MRLSATAMQLKSQRKAPLTPARPFQLTSPGPTPYHSPSIAPCTEHHGGMADPIDNQEPVDPLTVGELITLQVAHWQNTHLDDFIWAASQLAA